MKTDASTDASAIEIIEVIDDEVDPFSERPQNTTVHDSGGPRWVGPTAAVALVALIGYGIATSASTSSVPKVAEAPSTTVAPPTTETVTRPTTEPRPVVPYYSADPPREYRVQYAEIIPDGQVFFPGEYQLWAMPGASATAGSWFSIESRRTGPTQIYAVDAFRVPTTDQTMAISRVASGQSRIQFMLDDVMSVTITAFGWGDEDLVRLAQSMSHNEVSLAGDGVVPSDPTLIDDFQMLTTIQPFRAVFGEPEEQVYYSAGSDPSLGFSIGVMHLDPRKGDEEMAARRTALRFLLDRPTTFDVDGRSAVAGAIVGQPDQALATWVAGDHVVSVVGTMAVQEIIMLARTVHQVSSDEWEGMQFQASRNSYGLSGDFTETEPHAVSFGTDANGAQWTVNVSVSLTPAGEPTAVNWQWLPGSGFGSITDDTAKVTSVVDGDRTFVVAELPRAMAPTAQLHVTRTGLDPVQVPFNDTDPGLDRTFAAFVFSEPTAFTAQIIGTDGAVLATWPSA